MERLSYEDYQKYGGKCSMSDFPMLLLDCETILNKFTFNRIQTVELTSQIKRLMVLIIQEIQESNEIDRRVTSYSDGIESITYNTEELGKKSLDNSIYKLCLQYLPDSLLYRGLK